MPPTESSRGDGASTWPNAGASTRTDDGYQLQREQTWTAPDGTVRKQHEMTFSGTDPYNYQRQKTITLPDGRTVTMEQTRTWDGTSGTMERTFTGPNGRRLCTETVTHIKVRPLETQNAQNAIASRNCFSGLRYLMMPILYEGDLLGQQALVTGRPYNGTAFATSDLECWSLSRTAYLELITSNPAITIVSRRLGNVPKEKVNAFEYYRTYPYRTDQWYFKDAQ